MKPLHEVIRSTIETSILTGKLMPGDRLPIEAAFMQEYGCSRMTVNKALSSLTQTGLLERRKRAGTFVARPRVHSMVLDVPDLAQEVARRGQRYGYQLIARKIRPAAKGRANEQTLAAGGELLDIAGLHYANDAPLALETRLISINAVPSVIKADLESEASGTWLLRHVPWTEAETRISALSANRTSSKLLKIDEGDACLSIERRTWRGNEPITNVVQLFVADAYDLIARFGSSQVSAPRPIDSAA